MDNKKEIFDCRDICPDCGSDDIEWIDKDPIDTNKWKVIAVCNYCDCQFEEYYQYIHTKILKEPY